MAKHIKPFLPGIYDLNEDSYIDYEIEKNSKSKEEMTINPNRMENVRDIHKDVNIKNIESQLKSALDEYWKNKKEAENIILEAKERLDLNLQNMYKAFDNAIDKLNSLGVEIKNDEIQLNELTVVLRMEKKMYELSDKDKIELYDIFTSLNKNHADACKELAKSMNSISEFVKYTEFGVFYTKPEGAKRYKEPYFRSELVEPMKESSELNESLFSKISEFFKTMGEKIKNHIFKIESSLEEFDSLMTRAQNILSK
jgi:hypothetical protein